VLNYTAKENCFNCFFKT